MFSIHKLYLIYIINQEIEIAVYIKKMHTLQKCIYLLLYEWTDFCGVFFQISSTFGFLLKSFCPGNLSLPIFLSFLLPHSFSHFLLTGIKWPKIKLHPECSGKLWKSFHSFKFHSKFSFLSHFPTCSLPNMLTKTTHFCFAKFFTIFQIYDIVMLCLCTCCSLWALFSPFPYGQC